MWFPDGTETEKDSDCIEVQVVHVDVKGGIEVGDSGEYQKKPES